MKKFHIKRYIIILFPGILTVKKFKQDYYGGFFMEDDIKEFGCKRLENAETGKTIQLISVIGEIEGHECAGNNTKTTKYEHMLPLLASLEHDTSVNGILFI